MAGQGSNNTPVVQNAGKALDQLKFEAASELGISLSSDGYYGSLATRDAGAIGGHVTRRLVQIGEQALAGQSS